MHTFVGLVDAIRGAPMLFCATLTGDEFQRLALHPMKCQALCVYIHGIDGWAAAPCIFSLLPWTGISVGRCVDTFVGMVGTRCNLSTTTCILLNVGTHAGNAVPAMGVNVLDRNGSTIW